MSETWADEQFDKLEAAYNEVPIEAKARIAELEAALNKAAGNWAHIDNLLRGLLEECERCPDTGCMQYIEQIVKPNLRAKGGGRMSEQTCTSCYFFYPCPCGECSYGICGNTKSSWLNEYVYEDMNSCGVCVPMTDEAKRTWDELRGFCAWEEQENK